MRTVLLAGRAAFAAAAALTVTVAATASLASAAPRSASATAAFSMSVSLAKRSFGRGLLESGPKTATAMAAARSACRIRLSPTKNV